MKIILNIAVGIAVLVLGIFTIPFLPQEKPAAGPQPDIKIIPFSIYPQGDKNSAESPPAVNKQPKIVKKDINKETIPKLPEITPSAETPAVISSSPPTQQVQQPVNNLLSLPEIEPSELTIVEDGAADRASYLEYFAAHREEIQFENSRFGATVRSASGVPLLPSELLERALLSGNFSEVQDSLATVRDFLTAKINYLKSIKIAASAVKLNQYMIGADKLTLSLIDKAFAWGAGQISKSEAQVYLEKYQATIAFYREQFQGAGITVLGAENILSRVFRFFGLEPAEVYAVAALPFGGLITFIQECSCLAGYLMYFTPGYVPAPSIGPIFISLATIFSPFLFLNKMPLPGHWILGNYLPIPGPCLSAALCVPTGGFIGIVTMAGTS